MLRSSIRSTGLPAGAWNGAWKRTLLSSARSEATSQVGRSRAMPSYGGWVGIGRNASRPTFAKSTLNGFGRTTKRGFRFTARQRSTQGAAEEPQSLSAKLKRLTKAYGWAAVGVYFGLSALDFPICYMFVRAVGADTIGRFEHYVVSTVTGVIPEPVRQYSSELVSSIWNAFRRKEVKETGDDKASDAVEMATWDIQEADKHNREEASLATQLALAYAIHKSLIFFRVPIAAAITPKVVKKLRSWGWNIGKKTPPKA